MSCPRCNPRPAGVPIAATAIPRTRPDLPHWTPSDDAYQAGLTQVVSPWSFSSGPMIYPQADSQGRVVCPNYDGSTTVRRVAYNVANDNSCYQCGYSPGVWHFAKWMRENYQLGVIYVPGKPAGRALRLGEPLDGHRSGYGLDLGILGGPNRVARGGIIADGLVMNAPAIGIQQVIWSRTAWTARRGGGGTWREYLHANRDPAYIDSNDHLNHIHMELSPAGAMRQTAWWATHPEPLMANNSRQLIRGTPAASGLRSSGSVEKPYEFDDPTPEEMEGTGKFGSDDEARWLAEVEHGLHFETSNKVPSSSYAPLLIVGGAAIVAIIGLAYAVTRD